MPNKQCHFSVFYRKSGLAQQNPYAAEFGISIANNFQDIQGRILNAPELGYGPKQSTITQVQNGVWNASAFVTVPDLKRWAILVVDDRISDNDVAKFSMALQRTATELGMKIPPHSVIKDGRQR